MQKHQIGLWCCLIESLNACAIFAQSKFRSDALGESSGFFDAD